MGRKTKAGVARDGRSDAISDAGGRTVSLKPFDAPKNSDMCADTASCGAIIHAARVDADGSRLAVATSDGVVRIVGIQFPDISYKIAELSVADREKGSSCNVWDVAWGTTRNFGSVLASCSEDRKIRIWRESGEEWLKWFEWDCGEKAGNSLRWAAAAQAKPITLAVGCSDDSILILKHADNLGDESGWVVQSIPTAHTNGVTVIQWAPPRRLSGVPNPDLLITGGADGFVKMWSPSRVPDSTESWVRQSKLEGHEDWISDLAWAPCVGIHIRHLLASAGRDRKVILWNQPSPSAVWVPMLLTQTHEIPWSLSFSITGHMLSISEADGRMTLWRENQGTWEETRYAQKIRAYQEKMRDSTVRHKPSSTFDADAASVSGDADLTKDQVSYSRSETSGYARPEDYAAQWSAATGYDYANYYAYYAKYPGKEHERALDYYGGQRGDRALTGDSRGHSTQRYPYGNYYPVESTPAEAYRHRKPSETPASKYDYDDYPDTHRSGRDKSYSYRDDRY